MITYWQVLVDRRKSRQFRRLIVVETTSATTNLISKMASSSLLSLAVAEFCTSSSLPSAVVALTVISFICSMGCGLGYTRRLGVMSWVGCGGNAAHLGA